jgi:hypothetical protein
MLITFVYVVINIRVEGGGVKAFHSTLSYVFPSLPNRFRNRRLLVLIL